MTVTSDILTIASARSLAALSDDNALEIADNSTIAACIVDDADNYSFFEGVSQ
jgi:hypothetical protein